MFCKCYFAALWEQAHALKGKDAEALAIKPKVKIQPIFLPTVSFLVESSEGYLASLYERFVQARRHAQGVIELGYVVLQYARLSRHVGYSKIPARTHAAILSIVVKMHTLHITSTAQCFGLIMATLTAVVPSALRWLWSGGINALFADSTSIASQLVNQWGTLNGAQQALMASVGQISGVVVVYSFTCFLVMADLLEGRYYEIAESAAPSSPANVSNEMRTVAEEGDATPSSPVDIDSARQNFPPAPSASAFRHGPRGWFWRIGLFVQIFADTALNGYAALTVYAMIPAVLAAWSLLRRGTDFEYIVAQKPE